MTQWKQFANKQNMKRTKTRKNGDYLNREEIIVQKMSSELSQTYSAVGERKVPFDSYDELDIPNITDAFQKVFANQIEKDTICDILAGERGPSFKRMMAQVAKIQVF